MQIVTHGLIAVLTALLLASCAARTTEIAPLSPAADMLSGTGQYDDDARILEHDSPAPFRLSP